MIAAHDARNVDATEIPRHDERGARWIQAPLVGRPEDVAVQPLHRLRSAARRPVVRRIAGVQGLGEGFLGPAPRVGTGLQQVVEPFVPEAVDL